MSEWTHAWSELDTGMSAEALNEALLASPRMIDAATGGGPQRDEQEILLHLCCGPCGEYPLQNLREAGWAVTGYFYNPNIHPEQERLKRAWNVLRLAELKDLSILYDPEGREEQWRAFSSERQSDHCTFCYALRMDRAAQAAAAGGFQYFTTSLLVSPYQDQDRLIEAAERAAHHHGVSFLAHDFRAGYRSGQEMAREDGLYRQKYCGCIYSLGETSPKFLERYLQEFGLDAEALPQRIKEGAAND